MPRAPMAHDPFMNAFAIAAAAACAFELTARMLADTVDELGKYAPAEPLDPLVKRIVVWMGSSHLGTPESREELAGAARVRNKLLHLELSRVTGRLVDLGAQLERGGVTRVDLATGERTKVADESITTGRVFGWLLESGSSGAFSAARELFLRSIVTLEEALTLHTSRAIEKDGEP